MKKGQHAWGAIEPIEGRQVQARCECGWNTTVRYTIVSEGMSLHAAKEEAELLLHAHLSKFNSNPDTGNLLD